MTRNVLELPTLVLNRNWQPVHVTTVVRALVMLWNETAKAVEPDEYRLYDWADWSELEPADGRPCVRSARRSLRAPEVICLAHYDRLPGAAVTFSRRNVAKRDHHTCQYCGAQPGGRRSRSTTSSRARRGVRRAGPTAWPPASAATPARPTAPRSRPA